MYIIFNSYKQKFPLVRIEKMGQKKIIFLKKNCDEFSLQLGGRVF